MKHTLIIFLSALMFTVSSLSAQHFNKEEIKSFKKLKSKIETLDERFYEDFDKLLDEYGIDKKQYNEISLAVKKDMPLPDYATEEMVTKQQECSDRVLAMAQENRDQKQSLMDESALDGETFQEMMNKYKENERFREKVEKADR